MVAVSELLYRDGFVLTMVFQLLELCRLFLEAYITGVVYHS